MSLRRCIVVLMLLLTVMSVRSQTLYGYDFTTGVDASKWITLTNPDTIRKFNNTDMYSPLVELDFSFGFLGTRIYSISVTKTGMITGNRVYASQVPAHLPLSHVCQTYPDPLIFPYGQTTNVEVMALWQTVGYPGNRTMVCEVTQRQIGNTALESHFQFQVEESTSTIRFVYGTNTELSASGQIGFTGNYSRFINVASASHVASTNEISPNSQLPWPGFFRYYQFMPICANVANISVSYVSNNSARITWSPFPSTDSCYIVRYWIPGSNYTEQVAWDTFINIYGLQSCSLYNVQVFTLCRNELISDAAPTRFFTVAPSCSNIPFTSLWDDFVECRTGSFDTPSTQIELVDSGYLSVKSRHTVHCDTSERDPHIGSQLRTIPIGHCSSVRLGNSNTGNGQESITYKLQVDTNNSDLLLLRYAVVEQNPNHQINRQPHVIFKIADSAGIITSLCDSANFISGSFTGWIPSGDNTLWRDWSAYGISLTEFHGQTIQVTISNFDCGGGEHWGYVYFTLEGVSKRLTSTVCGADTENTFRAPQGFNYRWYNGANPSITLSTADTLHVTTPGNYYCYVSYQLPGVNCGFTLASRAGMRYPVARFTSVMEDSCDAVRHFVNQSVIAANAAHTQLTNEPCERYLWRFSDGTTDSATNVTRTFGNGTYTVTLIAMLANGVCVDSVSQTFTINIPSDTIHAYSCQGVPYQFGDMVITESGQYSFVEDCVEHILDLTIQPYSSTVTNVADTICMGDTLFMGQTAYFIEGNYTQTFSDQIGCDSVVVLQLSSMPSYNIVLRDTLPIGDQYLIGDSAFTAPGRYSYLLSSVYGCDSVLDIQLSCVTEYDTTICVSSLPFTWDTLLFNEAGQRQFSYNNQVGTDSIITYTLHVRELAQPQITLDQNCDTDIYFIIEVGGGYHYTWLADSANSNIVTVIADSLYYIHASDAAYYYLQAEYPDDPSCSVTDSIYLDTAGLQLIIVDFDISPEHPSSETSSIILTDKSQGILSREWYVNGQLWPETSTITEVDISLSDDTIEFCLVGYRKFCHRSVCKKVVVEWISIYFPNVFTPESERNHHFTPVGTGIAEFEMWVYDRRGALMFHTTDIQQGWDGTSNGIKCRQEVYAYTCKYRVKQQKGYQTHTGTVLLLR